MSRSRRKTLHLFKRASSFAMQTLIDVNWCDNFPVQVVSLASEPASQIGVLKLAVVESAPPQKGRGMFGRLSRNTCKAQAVSRNSCELIVTKFDTFAANAIQSRSILNEIIALSAWHTSCETKCPYINLKRTA